MKAPAKTLSLRDEVEALTHAVTAAALLSDALGFELFVTDVEKRRAVNAIRGTLALVVSRLELLRRAVVGDLDPEVLVAEHNEHPPAAATWDDPNMLLQERSAKEKLARAKLVIRRSNAGAKRKKGSPP